ncbi:ribosome biogenesis GTPase Der [Candidatus Omnitrophota bacterium]
MEKHSDIPAICIVGRPNVGKSSLFNCLLGQRRAVVVEQSGTTRDRVEAIIHLGGRSVKLVDTGGFAPADKDELSMQVKDQIYRAMEEAAVILLVTDTVAGVTPYDIEVASLLRKFAKSVIVVANKTDNEKLVNDACEFYQLGFGEPEPVSCLHRNGIKGLKKLIQESLGEEKEEKPSSETEYLKIAIVGRPNVGKSSLINNMLERNRVIVSDIPGTTRDSIDTHFSYGGDDFLLIDTAGMRHKRKIKTPVDSYSMMRSKESIKRADVVMLLLDAADGATKDDLGILSFIEETGKAAMVLVNKWDLGEETEDLSQDEYLKHLVYASSVLNKFPVYFVSAKTGKNVLKMLEVAKLLDANLDQKISTPFLNKIFEKNDPGRVPVPRSKKRPNFLYIVQASTRPVEFKYFVNDPRSVLSSHMSFIENQLRANIPLSGIPIKINVRRSRKPSKKIS